MSPSRRFRLRSAVVAVGLLSGLVCGAVTGAAQSAVATATDQPGAEAVPTAEGPEAPAPVAKPGAAATATTRGFRAGAVPSTETDGVVTVTEDSCASICVGGGAVWTDSVGGTHPVRQAPVEVWQVRSGADLLLGSGATSDDGSFAVDVDGSTAGSDLYVRVLASGPGFEILDQFLQTEVIAGVAAGASVDIRFVTDTVRQSNTAFSLQNAMVIAHEYLSTVGENGSATEFADISIVYPSDGGSYYDGQYLNIDALDRWDWDVMLHEYGHFLADEMNIEANPGREHQDENLSDVYGKKIGVALAWGEGWPTYFAISALRDMDAAALEIPNIGDSWYQDTEDQDVTFDLEAGGTLGEDNEVTVMAVLWDLYDVESDGTDRVAMGSARIWRLLDAADPTTLSEAYAAVTAGASARWNAYNCVFSQSNVSPTVDGPAKLGVDDQSPTIRWSRGNGGSFENDRFTVEYRDSITGVLLFRSGAVKGTSYTAPDQEWLSAIERSRSGVNVTVIGEQRGNPKTGPYRSCAQRFDPRVAA